MNRSSDIRWLFPLLGGLLTFRLEERRAGFTARRIELDTTCQRLDKAVLAFARGSQSREPLGEEDSAEDGRSTRFEVFPSDTDTQRQAKTRLTVFQMGAALTLARIVRLHSLI
jgi:hypothetical protein